LRGQFSRRLRKKPTGDVSYQVVKPFRSIQVKSLEINPKSADSWHNKGVTLGKLGRNEEALLAFDKSLQINPDRANTWYNKGIVLRKIGLGEEALIAITKTKELRRKH
jgi:tetratricopeptide (TPR) repeat protein